MGLVSSRSGRRTNILLGDGPVFKFSPLLFARVQFEKALVLLFDPLTLWEHWDTISVGK
jgi:hypothetical protein